MFTLKLAFRNILNNKKQYTLIFLIIIICFSASTLLLNYAAFELSSGKSHENCDRIFFVSRYENSINTPYALTDDLRKYPVFKEVIRIMPGFKIRVNCPEESPVYANITYSEQSFFDIFDFKQITGSPYRSFSSGPGSVVLTESMALKLFGSTDITGESLMVESKPATVKGVIHDLPGNSVFNFDILASIDLAIEEYMDYFKDNWDSNNFNTAFLLSNPESESNAKNIIRQIFKEYDKDRENSLQGIIPLHKIYLSKLKFSFLNHGNITSLVSAIAIGLFFIIIATISYINLSFVSVTNRKRQLGLLKINNTPAFSVFRSIFLESIAVLLSGFIISLVILTLINKSSSGLSLFNSQPVSTLALSVILSLIIVMSCISGYFGIVLHGSEKVTSSGVGRFSILKLSLNRLQIIIQFVIISVLVLSSFIIQKQLKLIFTREYNFNREDIIVMKGGPEVISGLGSFSDELKNIPLIKSVAYSRSIPGTSPNSSKIKLPDTEEALVEIIETSPSFTSLYEYKLIEGRYFVESGKSDYGKIIINESFIKQFNLTDPIGKTIDISFLLQSASGANPGEIIGVIPDMPYKSFKTGTSPLLIVCDSIVPNYISVKYSSAGNNTESVVKSIQSLWITFFPDIPLEYFFLDEFMNNNYIEDANTKKVVLTASLLTVIISFISLVSLILVHLKEKNKEISIRKVFGASVKSLIAMLNGKYLVWIFIAVILSIPLTYYLITKWLNTFTLTIELYYVIFISGTLLILLLSSLIITLTSLSTLKKNPIENLRYE